ncbi:hypothetical protein HQQ80_10470 [Microbacteriaceae bacterium VKM Ac-2855]|nr:hypothetical protein [Microbacteriaceae bacterium VKM Ac-2855]
MTAGDAEESAHEDDAATDEVGVAIVEGGRMRDRTRIDRAESSELDPNHPAVFQRGFGGGDATGPTSRRARRAVAPDGSPSSLTELLEAEPEAAPRVDHTQAPVENSPAPSEPALSEPAPSEPAPPGTSPSRRRSLVPVWGFAVLLLAIGAGASIWSTLRNYSMNYDGGMVTVTRGDAALNSILYSIPQPLFTAGFLLIGAALLVHVLRARP